MSDAIDIIEDGGASGGGTVAITPADDHGAVALQSATPGTAQTGHANITGTAKVGKVVASTTSGVGVSGTATTGTGVAGVAGASGVGVSGQGTDNRGLMGEATTGEGVYGFATSTGIGVHGTSIAGPAGLFESGNNGNASATLIARKIASGTAPLIEAQDDAAAALFRVDVAGNITKIRGVTTTFPAANAAGALTNNGSGTFSYVAASGGITAQEQIDMAWQKKFFTDASLRPANERIAASLNICPTEDGTFGGTFTRVTGGGIWSAADNLTYWDLGAARNETLTVIAGAHMGGGTQMGLSISPTIPSSVNPTSDSFTAWIGNGGDMHLDRNVFPSATVKGTATGWGVNTTASRPVGLAIYFNATTDVLKMFVRDGAGGWIIVVDTTDTTFGGVRYVAVHRKSAGVSRIILPLTTWSD